MASTITTITITQAILRWFGINWSICGNSFKTVGKAFLMKLVERRPGVCKAFIKTKGGYFEESKIYFDLFNTFSGYYMMPYVLFHSFDVLTIIILCRK
jgi:hypothetical protein